MSEEDERSYGTVAVKEETKVREVPLAVKIPTVILCGALFGMALHKSGVYSATILRGQFNFDNFVMLQVFLAATAVSTLMLTIWRHFLPGIRVDPYNDAVTACGGKIGYPATVLGTFLLGCGMSLAGACPGTVYAQLGAGAYKLSLTIAGGITAAMLFGFLHPVIKPFMDYGVVEKKEFVSLSEASKTKISPVVAEIAVAVMMGGLAVAVSFLTDLPKGMELGFLKSFWSPVICGIIVGGMQLPITLVMHQNLGSAMSYCSYAGAIVFFTDKSAYLKKYREGFKFWWQPMYLLAAAAGSWIAGQLLTDPSEAYYRGDDVSVLQSFFGGFVLLIGSRLAGGCTSGHGISGCAHLCFRSFVAVGAMFAGAIGTQVIFDP